MISEFVLAVFTAFLSLVVAVATPFIIDYVKHRFMK